MNLPEKRVCGLDKLLMEDIVRVHISEIRTGDTILHTDGKIRTVCRNNIHKDRFMGISLWGDTYRLGTIPVKKIIYKQPR